MISVKLIVSLEEEKSRYEQLHQLYQVTIKESKTAVASTGNEKSREGSDIIYKKIANARSRRTYDISYNIYDIN